MKQSPIQKFDKTTPVAVDLFRGDICLTYCNQPPEFAGEVVAPGETMLGRSYAEWSQLIGQVVEIDVPDTLRSVTSA